MAVDEHDLIRLRRYSVDQERAVTMTHSHASRQMQRRGIPLLIVHWLEDFGEEFHDHNGAIILHFSKAARRRLERAVGRRPVRKMDEWLNAYLVMSTDGAPITVGFRYRRINN